MLSSPAIIGMLNSVLILISILMTLLASTTADYGILHTLPDFIHWHGREEELVRSFQERIEFLRKYWEKVIRNKMICQKRSWSQTRDNHLRSRFIEILLYVASLDRTPPRLKQLLELPEKGESGSDTEWIELADKMYSSQGFVNIQLYNLHRPEQISSGLTFQTSFGGHLRSVECSEIGMFALTQKWVYMTIQWLELAQRKSEVSLGNLGAIPALLSVAIQEHNMRGHRKDPHPPTHVRGIRRIPGSSLFSAPILASQNPTERKELALLYFERYRGWGQHNVRDHETGMDLCKGNLFQPPKVTARLKCYYEHRLHPYFYPGPIKTEVLSKSPYILQFYQVLSNTTIDQMKALHRGRVIPETDIYGAMALRTCGNHARHNLNFLEEPEQFQHMSHMLSGGLAPLKKERENMFGEYTYGRLYHFHIDHSDNITEEREKEAGERFATLLYYLELPELGGYTAFMGAGVHARPERGSAIFWFNLFKNGTLRSDVTHGSCPVIHGTKIIVNHFYRYYNNWDRFKCTLHQWE